jgi:hypothetical protein
MVGLVTPSSVRSHWVLFEMGARWGQKQTLCCVLAKGADYDLLPDPIRNRHSLKVNGESSEVSKFVDRIADVLNLSRPSSWEYERFTRQFIAASLKYQPTQRVEESETALEKFKKRYKYEETVCWKYDDDGNRDGPFCPNCADDGDERRLNPGATRGTYSCVVHKSSFWTAEFDRRPVGSPRPPQRPQGPWS